MQGCVVQDEDDLVVVHPAVPEHWFVSCCWKTEFGRLRIVDDGIDGSRTTTWGPRSTSPGAVLTGATWKRCAAVPLLGY